MKHVIEIEVDEAKYGEVLALEAQVVVSHPSPFEGWGLQRFYRADGGGPVDPGMPVQATYRNESPYKIGR